MATKENPSRRFPPQGFDCRTQSGLVQFGGSASGWAMRPLLTKRQVAPKHRPSGFAEFFREYDQQRRIAIRSGAVGEHQRIRSSFRGPMEEAADGNTCFGFINKLPARFHGT